MHLTWLGLLVLFFEPKWAWIKSLARLYRLSSTLGNPSCLAVTFRYCYFNSKIKITQSLHSITESGIDIWNRRKFNLTVTKSSKIGSWSVILFSWTRSRSSETIARGKIYSQHLLAIESFCKWFFGEYRTSFKLDRINVWNAIILHRQLILIIMLHLWVSCSLKILIWVWNVKL